MWHSAPHEVASRFLVLAYQAASAIGANGAGRGTIEEDSVGDSMPQRDEWSRLYQAAIRIKEMAPWQWMSETDIFGVRNPEMGEIGFVSIMGALGEHYAVAVYLGSQGLYRFWSFEESGPYALDDGLLAIPHLQASFEDRSELTKRDLDVIKTLSLKFRGRQA
jgi:hypothetical protein